MTLEASNPDRFVPPGNSWSQSLAIAGVLTVLATGGWALAAGGWALSSGSTDADGPPAAIQHVVDLEGRVRDPLARPNPDTGWIATVLVFVRTDCPTSNRYAPVLNRLVRTLEPRGIRFWFVYVDPAENVHEIRVHREDFGFAARAVRDRAHELVTRCQTRITPSVAVFRPDETLAYRGRIDDRYVDFGRTRPRARRHDLAEVLEHLLAGEEISRERTRAVGCPIPRLHGRGPASSGGGSDSERGGLNHR